MLKRLGLVLFCFLSTLFCQGQQGSVYQKRIGSDKAKIRDILFNYPDSVKNVIIEVRGNYPQIDLVDEAWLINAEGISFLYLADYERAEELFEKAVVTYEQAVQRIKNSTEGLSIRYYKAMNEKANSYNNLGVVYYEISDLSKAISKYQQSVEVLKELSECPFEKIRNKVIIDLALCNDNIGGIYSMFGEKEKALTYELAAEKLLDDIGSRRALQVKLNIANVYKDLGKIDSALFYTTSTYTALDSVSESYEYYNSCSILGSLYIASGRYDEAKTLLTKAIAYYETNSPSVHLIVAHFRMFDCLLAQKNFTQAKVNLDRGMDLAKQKGNIKKEADGYQNYHRYYTEKALVTGNVEDFKSSIEYINKHNDLQDSLLSLDRFKEFGELQTKYETEKKDLTIKSLEQEKAVANAQTKIYILIGAFVFLVMIALYVYQRLRTKKNQELLEKEKEVDRLKSDFFANISHEFRTPLTLILGPVETLLSMIKDKDQRDQLGFMKTNATRLLYLINQILDLSKLESGHLDLKVVKVNLINVLEGVTGSFQSLLDSKGISMELNTPDHEIQIYFDQSHLETICINLISNAHKFSERGGKIQVSLNLIDEGKSGIVELKVADHGIGISSVEVEHIFDRFYQAGSASEKKYEGSGIGLALTKELVVQHGGTIDVVSDQGKGTTVTVRMHLGKAHFKDSQPIGEVNATVINPLEPKVLDYAEEEVNVAQEINSEKPIILLIEDNAGVRSYVQTILKDYTVLEAPNGENGVEQAVKCIPDLVISDVMMPLMNGYEVLEKLKKDERTSHVPVILLTAKASVDSRLEGLQIGADHYLNKPFVPKELLLYVHNLIESRRKLRNRYNREVVLKPSDITINSVDEQFLERLMKILEQNHQNEEFSVDQLSNEVGMSRSQLHRKLHALTNDSTTQFIRSFRLQRAMMMLRKNNASVSEIAFKVGFSSHSYFNKSFQKHFGCTPSSVKEKVT